MSLFAAYDVRYLIIGGYAVMRYAQPRFTKDLDVLIAVDDENAKATYDALRAFGAPLENLTPDDFASKGAYYQLGVPPMRVDVMMDVPGIDFGDAWQQRDTIDVGGVPVHFIGKSDLVRAKKASGRPQDLLDVAALEDPWPSGQDG
ncbi:MAG: DUF6036 family nucleotidyltransferase [Trueperaceae bacterium]|nr:DUF6036 family nucleotidyltransferase [Trueperaceae bacterium]